MNLCSNCYGDLCLKQQQASMKSTVESSLSAVSPPSSEIGSMQSTVESSLSDVSPPSSETISISSPMIQPLVRNPSAELEKRPNRCTTCRKRVGLTGFKCRCGTTFCWAHRYPEVHGCTFDFKSAGREEIAKANPLVKAAKLQKI
ncbi:hypothetical protein F2Q69_00048863 [Brassica cretica]|uniref:AN1-type domain-containing protein n=1 Tax=Brassica cretica TaxID=69181 RepID=A0A8S9PXA6_BRACR|nr:hypothetical protein F2Q69_00048863 [Brassica cretica]